MTEPTNPERLAEIEHGYEQGDLDTLEGLLDCLDNGINALDHRNKGRDNWISDIKRYQADHIALLAEVARLTQEAAASRKQVNDIRHTVSHMLPAHDEPGVPDPGDHWRRVHHELVTEVAWIIAPHDFSERERRIRENRATDPTSGSDR